MELLLGDDDSGDGVTFLFRATGDFSDLGVWGVTTSNSSISAILDNLGTGDPQFTWLNYAGDYIM